MISQMLLSPRLPAAVKAIPGKQFLASGLNLRLPHLNRLPPLRPAPPAWRLVPGGNKIGLFLGCMATYARPGLAERALHILQSLNYEIILLTGCCGLAALSSGQREPARQAARSLGRSWQKYNLTRIVTLCTSCAHALAQEYPALGVATIGAEVIDINSLLSEYPQLGAGRAVFTQAYLHVSCHLEQAEALRSWLLEAGIAGLTIIDACCGGGGLLPFNSLQLSQAIPPRLPDSSLPLLTTCSGCYAQWLQVYPGKVIHPLEALRLE